MIGPANIERMAKPKQIQRQSRMSSCLGKAAFATHALASAVASRGERRKGPRDVYRCQFCGQYHLGTRNRT